jgi:hypothetical protein
LNPQSEQHLDWLQLTVCVTVMTKLAKGMRSRDDPGIDLVGGPSAEVDASGSGGMVLVLSAIWPERALIRAQLAADCGRQVVGGG